MRKAELSHRQEVLEARLKAAAKLGPFSQGEIEAMRQTTYDWCPEHVQWLRLLGMAEQVAKD